MKRINYLLLALLLFSVSLLSQPTDKFKESKKYLEQLDINKLKQAVETNNNDGAALKKISSIMRSGNSSSQVSQASNVIFKTSNVNLDQLLEIEKLKEETSAVAKVKWNEKNGTVTFVGIEAAGNKLSKTVLSLEGRKTAAINFLSKYKNLLKLNDPAGELSVVNTDVELNGQTHIKYQQIYKGIKVWGCYVYAHLNGCGDMKSINGNYEATPSVLSLAEYNLQSESAVLAAKADLNYNQNYYSVSAAEKIIYHDLKRKPHLAYFVELKPTLLDQFYYFIDAVTGEIIHKYNNTKTDGPVTGTGTDLLGKTRNLNLFQKGSDYYLIDASKDMYSAAGSAMPDNPKGAITVLDLKNADHTQTSKFYYLTSNSTTNWAQNAVSLSYALSKSYDYYKDVHGLKSWDNNGMNIYGVVNLGTNYLNAYSTGPALFFGNGDNIKYQDFTRALDIIGHEYGHSVTTYHSNLEYQFQSGALNEAYSDYSGAMIEYYDRPASFNWLIAEDAVVTSSGKIAGRDMSNPANSQVMDPLPTKMSEYMTLTSDQDNGGVHINCGIPSRAFYLIAQSIGRDKMEKIIYRAYTKYLTQKSQFIDLRIAAIQSAKDLYPDAGYETQVGAAFDAVEIFDGSGTKAPTQISARTGNEYIFSLGGTGYVIKSFAKIDAPRDSSKYWLDHVSINSLSVTENGEYVFYVGLDNNIYMLMVSSGMKYKITSDGKWNNVSISPKGDYLAAIPNPLYEPSKIYFLNVNTSEVQAKTLFIPNTSENSAPTYAYYADISDFSIDGEYIIYDCYSVKTLQSGQLLDTWEIMLMRRKDGAIVRVFPPQANGILIGNPSFANTKENVFAFDLVDNTNPASPKYYVSTYNMFSGDMGLIYANNGVGYPTFSPNDKRVAYDIWALDGKSVYLYLMDMLADGLNGKTTSRALFGWTGFHPQWIAVGSRPVGIDKLDNSQPESYQLMNCFPNPFNSTATIKYYLPKYTNVKVEIYNVLGIKVKELFSGDQQAGYHNVQWNADNSASGTYFCRMTTPEYSKMVKLVLIK